MFRKYENYQEKPGIRWDVHNTKAVSFHLWFDFSKCENETFLEYYMDKVGGQQQREMETDGGQFMTTRDLPSKQKSLKI